MTGSFFLSRRALVAAGFMFSMAAVAQGTALPLLGTSHLGEAVTAEKLGGWRLVYFGYTFCPDVCPLGLQTMTQTLDALGPLGERFTPVFVTVDPERDTPAVMKDYVAFFHPRFIGLTPSPEQLKDMAAAWKIKYQKVEGSGPTSYSVDHTASVFMLNPQGQVLGRFSHDLSPEAMAGKIKQAILRAP